MDIATMAGVLAGVALLVWAILMGSGLGSFLDLPSALVVLGGTACATLINFPLAKVLGVFSIMKKALLYKLPALDGEIKRITEFAQIARKEGLLALEDKLESLNEPLLQKGIQLVIDGTPPEVLRSILTIDVATMGDRHSEGKTILEVMGAFAPAFGMIGTLIGLVQMLGNLKDPSQVGSGMAVALITTFYGAVLANLIFLPAAGKLSARHKEEALLKELLIEGVLAIQAGDNPRTIEEKLKSFLPPSNRAKLEQKDAA
ncbi:MAG TPA: MotA/TolQ/ExbB proton channel family protein [Planctomycetota bacterium]|nr:MotA/TolQ/ExbB proton channel family protein [Planctomycetota bacterium]HUW30890.1 MotA/TolQ/ExbB proton channel family protein [Planctomycetota bacterium]